MITLLREKKFLRISVFEWLAIALIFSLFFILLVKVAGGPTTSDEFFYMNLSINGIKSYLVLDYYFHIYLQRFFLLLAPSALAGAKYFWAFLVTTSSFLIYLSRYSFSFRFRPLLNFQGLQKSILLPYGLLPSLLLFRFFIMNSRSTRKLFSSSWDFFFFLH
jgi:hypothetical protein